MGFLFNRGKTKVGIHHTYGLTELGATKADEFALSGPKWEVVACLRESGPSSIAEISEETKISNQKVKVILKGMIQSGYVRRVSAEGEK